MGELGAVFVFVFCFLVFWLRALTIVQWQWSPHSVPVDRCCTVGPLLRDGSTWALLFVFRVVLVRGGVVVLAALTCWVLAVDRGREDRNSVVVGKRVYIAGGPKK